MNWVVFPPTSIGQAITQDANGQDKTSTVCLTPWVKVACVSVHRRQPVGRHSLLDLVVFRRSRGWLAPGVWH